MNIQYHGPEIKRMGSTPRERVLMSGLQVFGHAMGLGGGSAPASRAPASRAQLSIKKREEEKAARKRKIIAARNK